MTTATLLCDETGNFGDATRTPDSVNVVGGIIIPRIGQRALATRWSGAIASLCKKHNVPPHAREIRDVGVRAEFLAAATTAVRDAGGWWLFVRAPEAQPEDAPLGLYLRVLETWVDLAARLAWSFGADEVDVVPAQRTVPFSHRIAERAVAEQAGRQTSIDEHQTDVRAMVRPGVRVTIEQLRQEGGPSLGEVRIDPAATERAHPGIDLCDFGCFAVRQALVGKQAWPAQWPEANDDGLLVVAFDDATTLRRLARTAREPILDIARLSTQRASLYARHKGSSARDTLVRSGAARVADQFHAAAISNWAREDVSDARVQGLLATLAGATAATLDAKQGDYEGTWSALVDAWVGDGALAARARRVLQNVQQAAHLERLVLECANHRGDVVAADAAWIRFAALTSKSSSLALLSESLTATNVRHGALQNRLPARRDEVAHVREQLENAAGRLIEIAKVAEAVVGMADELRVGAATDESSPPAPPELALWNALGRTRPAHATNSEVGRCFGSAARTWAFLGAHEKALDLALEARARFGDDSDDLKFNARVLVRLLCDEARVVGSVSQDRIAVLRSALRLAGSDDLRTPEAFVREALPGDAGLRFGIDGLLRCLLWASVAVEPRVSAAWSKYLALGKQCDLFRQLSESVRSHPSELIARHAGELVKGDARRDWLDLSIQLSSDAAAGATLNRFAAFTKALCDATDVSGEPAGSELQPTFEYR